MLEKVKLRSLQPLLVDYFRGYYVPKVSFFFLLLVQGL